MINATNTTNSANKSLDADLVEIEALLVSAQRVATNDADYWHSLNDALAATTRLIDEIRVSRAAIDAVQGHQSENWLECPCCYARGDSEQPIFHIQDCALAIYNAFKLEQAQYYP